MGIEHPPRLANDHGLDPVGCPLAFPEVTPMQAVTIADPMDHAGIRDRLIAILSDLDMANEPVAAVHVNEALEIILAKVPLSRDV